MKKVLITLALALGVLAGVPAASASAAPYCGITWGSTAKSSSVTTTRPLTNIRTGQHDCYDRMVFDLSGTGATGYSVQYVSNIRADGSGAIIPLGNGTGAKLQIVLRAPAYNAQGHPTYPGVTGAKLPGVNLTGYKTFREARFAGSFEGQTTVGLGVRAQLPFRVTTSDYHVIIDVAHQW